MLKKVSLLTVALFVAAISLTAAQTSLSTSDDDVYRGGKPCNKTVQKCR